MTIQNKFNSIYYRDNAIESLSKTPSYLYIKYPMLIFSNQYFKSVPTKKFLKNFYIKAQLIFILNLSDLLFTHFLVLKNPKFFLELNPFAKEIIYNLPLTLSIKLILVIFTLLYLKIRSKKATFKGLKLINLTVNLIFLLYSVINIIHILNFTLLLSIINNY